jgi:hypothetical protein
MHITLMQRSKGNAEVTQMMESILIGLAILAGWFFLQWYVLPKMGIDT